MDPETLEYLGLPMNEAKVYLALLELGSSTMAVVARKSGLHRPVVYDVMSRLMEKGLVGRTFQGLKKVYFATSPERLQDMLKEKEKKLAELMPKLIEMRKPNIAHDVQLYMGKSGLQAVLNELLRAHPSEYLSLGSGGGNAKALLEVFERFNEKRTQIGIACRALFRDTPIARERGNVLDRLPSTQIRYLPKGFTTPTRIYIYNTTTILHLLKEDTPFIIVIDNKDIATSLKETFEWIWKRASQTVSPMGQTHRK